MSTLTTKNAQATDTPRSELLARNSGVSGRAIWLVQAAVAVSSLTSLLPLSHYRSIGESLGAGDIGSAFVLRAVIACAVSLPIAAVCSATRRLTGVFVTGFMWAAITTTSALIVPGFGWFTIAWGMLGVSDALLAVSVPALLIHFGQRPRRASAHTWLLQFAGAGVGLVLGTAIEPLWNVTWRGVGLVLIAGFGPVLLAASTVTISAASNRTETALSLGEVLARVTAREPVRRAMVRAGVAAFVAAVCAHTILPLLATRWLMSGQESNISMGLGFVFASTAAFMVARQEVRRAQLAVVSLVFVMMALVPSVVLPPTDKSSLRFVMAFVVVLPIVAAVVVLCASAAQAFDSGLDSQLDSRVDEARLDSAAATAGLLSVAFASGTLIAVILVGTLDRRFGTEVTVITLAVLGCLALSVTSSQSRSASGLLVSTLTPRLDQTVLVSGVPPILQVSNIDLFYGTVQVLFDVSLAIQPGEIVALLGTNGAGKSSLLKVISGQVVPQKGIVLLSGTDVTSLGAERRVPLGLIQIPGGKAVFGPLSVSENLELFASSLGGNRKQIQRGMERTFRLFPRLAERKDQAAETLSGGEQQMLALGKALLLQPHILCIDELSLGLAPAVVADLLNVLRSIHQEGTTIVLVEQSLNVAFSIAQRAVFMEKGEIRFDGDASELRDRSDLLRSVFFA
jgi:ABC-type branched-subunit amino acid transport system ATPase component